MALHGYLTAAASRYDEDSGKDRFAACGLDESRLERVIAACTAYLAR